MSYEGYPRRHSFVLPILFIGAGIYFLLVNLGYITPFSWSMIVRFWPVLLIAIGLDILFGRRSWIGALLSGIFTLALIAGLFWLILLGPQHVKDLRLPPALSLPALQQRELRTPLGSVKEARISVNWDSGDQRLGALPESSKDLLNGQAMFYNSLNYEAECRDTSCDVSLAPRFSPEQWMYFGTQSTGLDLSLNPKVIYDLFLDLGSGEMDYELSDLKLKGLEMNLGSGDLNLALPGGTYRTEIDCGSGEVRISLPEDTGLRMHLRSGSGDLYAPSLHLMEGKEHGRGIWESENYGKAAERIDLEIDQGSGDLEITAR